MTRLPDHIAQLKHRLSQARRNPVAGEPHWFYLEGFATAIDEPFEVREALARLHFLRNVPITIHPGEAIVGQIDWNEPLVCQVSNTHLRKDVLERIYADAGIPLEEKETIRGWVEAVRPFCFDPWPHLSPKERLAQESHLAPSTFFNGHVVADFGWFITHGLDGALAEIEHYRQRPLTSAEENFYRAMELTAQGMALYIQRYADLAGELLAGAAAGHDAALLGRVQEICGHIAHGAPRNFPEALQLVWFLMCFMDYDSFGRYDQYLWPAYQASKTEGMSAEEALLWLKYAGIKTEECGGILNLTLAGRDDEGGCAANELTYLVLRSTRELGFRSPNLALRISAADPAELWQAVYETISSGQGLPALYNDDLVVPMLESLGYSSEEARGYALAGCSQVVLPGISNFACDVGCYNLAKALELALHDGFDVLLGSQVGPQTGDPATFHTFADLKAAYDRQMKHMTRVGAAINDKDTYLRRFEGACVRSLVTRDCVERGRGIFHGGARHNGIQNEACGITNAANSLHAIRQLVYEEKVLSLTDLIWALDHDWGKAETLRLRFRNRAAKFGNDLAEVDELRAEIAEDWYRELQQYPALLGGFHWPGEVVFVYHELHGAHTAASADGRHHHEPLANSAGATSGTDLAGPTALINSMLRLNQSQCRTCCVLNLRFTRQAWERNPQAIQDLLRSYFTRGGFQVQINLVSREQLLAARANPDAYADLVVRVGGFSDYFVRLGRDLQDEIIARTEHDL